MPLSARTRRLALPVAAFLFGVVTLATTAILVLGPAGDEATAPSAVGGPFRLVGHDGTERTERDFAGAPFLVFFGFTHCPDICPTKLFEISQVLEALGKDRKANALFVSVDPERDTPEVLKSYLSSFDPRIVGLTGSPEQVQAMLRAYRGYAKKVPLKEGDYTMDHTAIVYLMDKKGAFVGSFNLTRPPAEAAQDLARRI